MGKGWQRALHLAGGGVELEGGPGQGGWSPCPSHSAPVPTIRPPGEGRAANAPRGALPR